MLTRILLFALSIQICLRKQNDNFSHCNCLLQFNRDGAWDHLISVFFCSPSPSCWLIAAGFSLDTVLAHQPCLTGSVQGWCVLGTAANRQEGRGAPAWETSTQWTALDITLPNHLSLEPQGEPSAILFINMDLQREKDPG